MKYFLLASMVFISWQPWQEPNDLMEHCDYCIEIIELEQRVITNLDGYEAGYLAGKKAAYEEIIKWLD